jgi:hypothetical protein
MPVGFIFGGSDAPSPEAMQAREDAAKDAYERAARRVHTQEADRNLYEEPEP